MKLYQAAFLGALFIVSACKKEEKTEVDTQKPNITIETPTSTTEVVGGQLLNIRAKLTDNLNLSQYKIEIHPNFDGHSHGKTLNETVVPFEWDTLVNISGKEHLVDLKIPISSNAKAGSYDLLIQCIDQAGYEAPIKFVSFKIKNPDDLIPPSLNLTFPSITAVNEIIFDSTETSKSITLQGSATDNKRIKSFTIQLLEEKTSGDEDKIIYQYQWDGFNSTSLDLSQISFSLQKDDLENDAEYHLKVKVYDAVGNDDEKDAMILIKKN